MHADEAVGAARLRGKLGDRDRGCVAREDHAGAEERIDFLEHANLQVALLRDSLNHEIGADQRHGIRNKLDAGERS